jgi:ribosomal protein S18 acetylase RimI-like enzyme
MIRQRMLYPNQPMDKCQFDKDDEEQTFHLGAFVDSKLVSVASFTFERHPDLQEPYQFHLQGMATLPDHQKKGLSSELLKIAFPIVKQNMCNIVWCHARENAVGYYEKVGFEQIGEPFDVPGEGPHRLMLYRLS